MADRGRKARPMSSRLCHERYEEHCHRLHLERLRSIKSRLDNKTPKSMKMDHMKSGNNHKKNYLDAQRAKEILKENDVLLNKMTSISRQQRVLKPWSARTSLNFRAGYYYDSGSSQAFVDNHLSLPRNHPRGGKSEFSKMEEAKALLRENQKILNAIETRKPFISSLDHARHAELNESRVDMLSTYHGPRSARYIPQRSGTPTSTMRSASPRMNYTARSIRPSSSLRNSAYSQNDRTTSPSRSSFYKQAISTAPSAPGARMRYRPQTAPAKKRSQVEKELDTSSLLGALPQPNTEFALSRGNSFGASAAKMDLGGVDEDSEDSEALKAKSPAEPNSEEHEVEAVQADEKASDEQQTAASAEAGDTQEAGEPEESVE